jgi:hypothetical protein
LSANIERHGIGIDDVGHHEVGRACTRGDRPAVPDEIGNGGQKRDVSYVWDICGDDGSAGEAE